MRRPAIRSRAAGVALGAAVWALATAVSAAAVGVVWAALAPLELPGDSPEREALFEIPHGTYARRAAGDKADVLPDTIHLRLAVRDVLHLRNLDEVPQVFGPTVLMPGQSFRLPFAQASTYSFACTAHSSGQMSVVVAEAPAPGLARLRWRFNAWMNLGSQRP